MAVLCLSLFCCELLIILSSFAIILKRKRELAALLLLSYGFLVTVYVLWLFPMVPWVGLQCVIVVFPDHTHLLFCIISSFAIILMGKRELIALLCSSSWCLVTVVVLWLLLTEPCVGLQCVIVVKEEFPIIRFYLYHVTSAGQSSP